MDIVPSGSIKIFVKGLPKDIIKIVKLIENKKKKNKKITLNLALNYGSKQEIVQVFKN